VSLSEDPCYGTVAYYKNANMQIRTNDIKSRYFVFKNAYSVKDTNVILANISYSESAALNYIRNSLSRKDIASSNQDSTKNYSTRKQQYSSPPKSEKKLSSSNSSYETNSTWNCSQARSELESASRAMRQAKNFYNINQFKCNSSSTCPTPMPRHCQNSVGMCRNNSYSCRAGDYSCMNRANSNYQSCRSRANQQYSQCQQNARNAAENQRRSCLSRVQSVKTQCLSNLRSQASSLIAQASARESRAERKIFESCN
jgi:hypothetical protein